MHRIGSIQVIEAPEEFHRTFTVKVRWPTIFLGGSISNAENWQARLIEMISEYDHRHGSLDIIAINPRRENFNTANVEESDRQTEWEYRHLRRADLLVFWFSYETVAPITLFECGAHTHSSGKPIIVGVHPNYARRRDVEIQLKLVRPDVEIVYCLEALADKVYSWYSSLRENQ